MTVTENSVPKASTSDQVEDTSGLTASVITSRCALESYADQWNELLSASKANTIFLTWEWISTWLDVVYPEAQLLVVIVRDSQHRLVAIAPFYLSDLRLVGLVKYKSLRVIGDCQSGGEYGDVIMRDGFESVALRCVMHELMRHTDLWDCLWLCNLAGWTGSHGTLKKACASNGFWVRERLCDFAAVTLPATYDAYIQMLAKKRRGYLRRETRRLHASHAVELIQCDRPETLPAHLGCLFELHRKRWESVGQHGAFVRRPLMQQFYEAFAPKALQQGWLRFYILSVDGVPQAAQYGYVYAATYHALQEGFNPHVENDVGNTLRSLVFEKCIEEGLVTYDFLGGFSDHKRHWRAQLRHGCDLFIGRKSAKNHLLFWMSVWPSGRFIREGRPASEGHSHD